MKPVALRIDELPPMRVPLRFYLTAPVFGVLAGLTLLVGGEQVFVSRWMPAALAMTHLLTLGVLAMVIVGSLFQVLPVLGGGSIPGARHTASVVHPLLTVGAAALSHGLLAGSSAWLTVGTATLGLGLGGFAILVGTCVLRRHAGGDALFTIRLAALGMAATIGLGLVLALGMAWPSLGIPFRLWTDAHALFGLGALTLLLVMGVSFQVVPMFHVAPPFDTRITRGTSLGVFVGVLGLAFGGERLDPQWPAALLGLASAVYAIALLTRLHRRRRRRAEPLVRAWQLAATILLATIAVGSVYRSGTGDARLQVVVAVLFGYGFALTVVLAMLGKIVAFLAFTHLQRRCLRAPAAIPLLPTMDDIVGERAAWTQLGAHTIALLALCAAAWWPALTPLAGATMIADFAVCGRNMLGAALRYGRAERAIRGAATATGH